MFVLAVWQCWSQAQLNPEDPCNVSESTSTPSSIIFPLWAGIRSPPPHIFGHLIGFHLDDRLLIMDSQMSLLPLYTENKERKKKLALNCQQCYFLFYFFLILITESAAGSLLLLICKLIINTQHKQMIEKSPNVRRWDLCSLTTRRCCAAYARHFVKLRK